MISLEISKAIDQDQNNNDRQAHRDRLKPPHHFRTGSNSSPRLFVTSTADPRDYASDFGNCSSSLFHADQTKDSDRSRSRSKSRSLINAIRSRSRSLTKALRRKKITLDESAIPVISVSDADVGENEAKKERNILVASKASPLRNSRRKPKKYGSVETKRCTSMLSESSDVLEPASFQSSGETAKVVQRTTRKSNSVQSVPVKVEVSSLSTERFSKETYSGHGSVFFNLPASSSRASRLKRQSHVIKRTHD